MEDTQKNGLPWPGDPLEASILSRLEDKSSNEYMWPRWAAAEEAAEAAREYVLDLIEEAQGDTDFIIWSLIKKN